MSDVHRIASAMPHARRIEGPKGDPVYQVGGKSFVFFLHPAPCTLHPAPCTLQPPIPIPVSATGTSSCCG